MNQNFKVFRLFQTIVEEGEKVYSIPDFSRSSVIIYRLKKFEMFSWDFLEKA